MRILDNRDQVLRRKTVRLVKVLWQHRGVEEATEERDDTMWATYPFLFEDEGTLSNNWHQNNYCRCICLCVLVCMNFGDEILLRGEEYKIREKKSVFLKMGKIVILVGNWKFSRSRKVKRISLLNFVGFRDSRNLTFFEGSGVG